MIPLASLPLPHSAGKGENVLLDLHGEAAMRSGKFVHTPVEALLSTTAGEAHYHGAARGEAELFATSATNCFTVSPVLR
jgi:hypothetical protein